MTKRSASSREGKSLKTFFIYAGIVCFFILLSLSVKAFFVLKASRFDGQHQFTLALSQRERVQQLVSFNPQDALVTVLRLQNSNLSASDLAKKVGIIPDAGVSTKNDFAFTNDPSNTMTETLLHYQGLKTNMTVVDVVRLFILTKRAQIQVKEMNIAQDVRENDRQIKQVFTDDALVQENISIQIVNASGESGAGKRLERIISNLGGNVVAVQTSQKTEPQSKIIYFEKETYTLRKLQKLLGFPRERTERESIANLTIVIGEN